MDDKKLPPLPGSDSESLDENKYDSFYQTGSADFWSGNEVIREKVKNFENCQHQFVKEGNDAVCGKCHLGFENFLAQDNCVIKDGQLFYKGKKVDFRNSS